MTLCRVFRGTGKAKGQLYQCWWRICREINVSSRFEYHMFYVLYPLVTYLLTLPRIIEVSLYENTEISCVHESTHTMHTHTLHAVKSGTVWAVMFKSRPLYKTSPGVASQKNMTLTLRLYCIDHSVTALQDNKRRLLWESCEEKAARGENYRLFPVSKGVCIKWPLLFEVSKRITVI
jgi:hypothetical protein